MSTSAARLPATSVRAAVPSTTAVLAIFLFVAWGLEALSTDVSPWTPLVFTIGYLVIDLVLGFDREKLASRLCLLFAYGLLSVLIHWFVTRTTAGVFFEDESSYDSAARSLANGVPAARLGLDTGWPQLLSYFYGSLGNSLVLARYLNCVFGALLVGITIEIARGLETRAGSSQKLFWLAGASPALLVWVVAGVRDLGVGVGAALVALALLRPERRVLRLAAGVGLAVYLAPAIIWVLAAFFVCVLAFQAIDAGRIDALAALMVGTILGIFRWGIALADKVNERYFAPAAQLFVASTLHSTGTITGSLQASTPFPLAAPFLVILQPIWFAMLAEPTLRTVLQAIGGLGWWLLLPLMLLGVIKSWSEPSTRPFVLWAFGALILAAIGLLTVVQDAPRLRVVGLGAFFLLAWRAIDLEPVRSALWAKRWLVVQLGLAGVYWLARVGFPIITHFVPALGV